MSWKENIKHLFKLAFMCGIGWLIVQGILHNQDRVEGIVFFSLLIGWGFYAAYYLGREKVSG